MLSLLSLIIASGTVLRADTELWEPFTYPDPRTNATQCNTIEGSTLCDPDHILTDTWRQILQQNIAKQTQRLQNVEIQYAENASEECRSNTTKSVQIFVILAKRIHTASNQSITSNDLQWHYFCLHFSF
uniref:Laminin N-terminal domain-containing protein n=1 Tax=Heterorhabditis bacteriophora TaxID=37862 RepID=A0A1I7WU77_HETBA